MSTKTKKPAPVCPTCGAKTQEYAHGLTPALVNSLRKLLNAGGGPLKLAELDLTYSERCNFQKLRYFDLAKIVRTEDGRRTDMWLVTMKGRAFLNGSIVMFPKVWTYHGERVRFEGAPVRVTEIVGPNYQSRDQWAAEAKPHDVRS